MHQALTPLAYRSLLVSKVPILADSSRLLLRIIPSHQGVAPSLRQLRLQPLGRSRVVERVDLGGVGCDVVERQLRQVVLLEGLDWRVLDADELELRLHLDYGAPFIVRMIESGRDP